MASAPAPRLDRSSDLPVSRRPVSYPHVSSDGPISVGALLRREGRRASHALDRPVVPRARDVRNDESGGTAHGIALTAGALLALSAVIGTSAVGEVTQGTVSAADQTVGLPPLGRGTAVIPAPAAAGEAPPPPAAAVPPAATALAALSEGAGVEPASGAGIVAQALTPPPPPPGSAGSAVSVSEADTVAVPVVRTATDSPGSSEPGGSSSQPPRTVISVPGPSNPAPSVPAPSVPAPSAPAPSAPAASAPARSAPAPAAPAPSPPGPTDPAPSAPAPPFGGGGLVPAGEKDAPAEDRDGDLADGDLADGGTHGATGPGTDAGGSDNEGSGGAVTDSANDDASADDETTDSADKVAADGAEDGAEGTAEDAGTETESADSAVGFSADTGSNDTSDATSDTGPLRSHRRSARQAAPTTQPRYAVLPGSASTDRPCAGHGRRAPLRARPSERRLDSVRAYRGTSRCTAANGSRPVVAVPVSTRYRDLGLPTPSRSGGRC